MTYDSKKANAWLEESSKNPRWVGNREEVKPRERVVLIPEDVRMKFAKAVVTQGFIPHHATGDSCPVTSIGEALIIIDYVHRCKADAYEPPKEVPRMNAEEEAALNRWMQEGRK